MPRIFLPVQDIKPGLLSVTGENARYLTTVLRCRSGDAVTVCDSKCKSYPGKIIRAGRKEITVEITGPGRNPETESPLRITLLQGLLKGDKMDLVIQKATELGVTEIIPVVTERSQVRETRKLSRWQKIAQEASRQAGRVYVPVIHNPTALKSMLRRPPVADRGVMFWEQEGERLSAVIRRFRQNRAIELFTGPEGGFSAQEVKAAEENGFSVATLGKRTLRAETAAIVALGIVQYKLGDLGTQD